MKKSELQKIIKEELQKEIKINRPINYIVNSDEYKKFYQLVELCNYWNVDVNPNGDADFSPLNNFYFFYALYTTALSENWTPEQCIVSKEDIEAVEDNFSLDKGEIEQLINKLREHS